MAPDLGERSRRRHDNQRRRIVVLGSAAGLAVLVGAVVFLTRSDAPTRKVSARQPAVTSSSSTSTSTTITTIVPRSTNPVVALAQQYDGAYEGTFENSTSGTSGAVALELRVDPDAGTLDIS